MTFFDFVVYLLEHYQGYVLIFLLLTVALPCSIRAFMQSWPAFEASQLGQWLCRHTPTWITQARHLVRKGFLDIKDIVSFTSPNKLVIPSYKLGKLSAWWIIVNTIYCAAFAYFVALMIFGLSIWKAYPASPTTLLIGVLVMTLCFGFALFFHGLACRAAKENGINLTPWR